MLDDLINISSDREWRDLFAFIQRVVNAHDLLQDAFDVISEDQDRIRLFKSKAKEYGCELEFDEAASWYQNGGA